MKLFKLFFIICINTLCISACTTNHGKEYKLDDKHSVYYKGEGVDEAIAKKLADYLKVQEYFIDSLYAAVQLVKIKDTFNINFMVDETRISRSDDNKFLIFGAHISEVVFNKAPVTVQLTKNKLEPFKNLGFARPVSEE